METKRYVMIKVAEEACRNGYQEVLRDLVTIPEVQFIERLDGIFDLMVQVECPATVGYAVADHLLAKRWVKSLQVLQVEPAEPGEIMPPTVLEMTTKA